jgi:hypothetical protein
VSVPVSCYQILGVLSTKVEDKEYNAGANGKQRKELRTNSGHLDLWKMNRRMLRIENIYD